RRRRRPAADRPAAQPESHRPDLSRLLPLCGLLHEALAGRGPLTAEAVLAVSGISKSFGGTRAPDRADPNVRPPEIHALLGGNGSGKSTLVKILAGVHYADSGAIELRAPVHFVHQDPAVFLDMSVADNLALGRGFETDVTGRIRWRSVRRRTVQMLSRFAIDARPETPVGELRPAARAMIPIARALQ